MTVNISTRVPHSIAPKGRQHTSPGQRPGFVVPHFFPSPERAKQGDAICVALSGLGYVVTMFTQGVALGWFLIAPSGCSLSGNQSVKVHRFDFDNFLSDAQFYQA